MLLGGYQVLDLHISTQTGVITNKQGPYMPSISAVLQYLLVYILSKACPWRRKLKPVHCFFIPPHTEVHPGEVQVSFILNQSISLKCCSWKQAIFLSKPLRLVCSFTTKRVQTTKIQSSAFSDRLVFISSISFFILAALQKYSVMFWHAPPHSTVLI